MAINKWDFLENKRYQTVTWTKIKLTIMERVVCFLIFVPYDAYRR